MTRSTASFAAAALVMAAALLATAVVVNLLPYLLARS